VARFKVVEREKFRGDVRYVVVDTRSEELPVAHFDRREDAEAHARKLEEGPLDLEEQKEWQEEDWGDWAHWD
jgi:hypothetical protein